MKRKVFSLILIILVLSIFAAANYTYKVIEKDCVGCGDCTSVCPVNAIEVVNGKAVIDTDKCISCDICKKACNYNAIGKVK